MDHDGFLGDRLAIEDVFARYAHAADRYDAEGWVDCYSEDGIFEVATEGARIQFVGRAKLQDFIHAHIRLLPGTRQDQTNHLVDISADREKHSSTMEGMLSRQEKVYTFISGWYESSLERLSGDWKIKKRVVHVDNDANFVDGELAEQIGPFMQWMAENGSMA